MSDDVFLPAIEKMNRLGTRFFGPEPFSRYLADRRLPEVNTWEHLSVDSRSRLKPSLLRNDTMVSRLGSPQGQTGTSFGLVRSGGSIDDFLLLDEVAFEGVVPDIFIPERSARDLFAYRLLPKLTETSLVNLALASKLLQRALGLDPGTAPNAPATGQSSFSFEFRPCRDSSVTWTHQNGQVEVDALFVGRAGRETLFVVEAKVGPVKDDLAKHKLVYPVLSVANRVPSYMDIVPVYLKIAQEGDDLLFYVAIRALPDPRDGPVACDALAVARSSCLLMPGFAM